VRNGDCWHHSAELPTSRHARLKINASCSLSRRWCYRPDRSFGPSRLSDCLAGQAVCHGVSSPQDGVEDGDQLPSGGNQSSELGLASRDEPVTEGFQRGVVTARHQGTHEQRRADRRATALDEAPAAPLAGLPRPRGQADQRGDSLSVKVPQLVQHCGQSPRDRRSNTRHRDQERLLPASRRGPLHGGIDRAVDQDLLLFKGLPQPYTKSGVAIVLGRDSIKLPKFGWLRILRHRKIKGRMRNVTVTHEGDRWYIVIQTEIEARDPPIRADLPAIGLDIGINRPIATSVGETIALPQMTKAELAHRAKFEGLNATKEGISGPPEGPPDASAV